MMIKKISSLLLATFLVSGIAVAQTDSAKTVVVPKNWHQLDPAKSGFNGISLDDAYALIKIKNLKSTRIIVAVIDSGIDTLHEDLKPILWTNPKEIPGNGIDDDHNGYIDDVHGWNFIGGKDGRNVKEDSDEGARVYNKLKPKWDGKEVDSVNLSSIDKKEYEVYLKAKNKIVGGVNKEEIGYLKNLFPKFMAGDSILRKLIGKEEYSGNDLQNITPVDAEAKMTKGLILNICKANNSYDITNNQLIDDINGQLRKADAIDNAPKEYRKEIVGDDETNINDRNYGNNDIMASTPFHGTHCSGIIAAVRNNGRGVDGIADNVRIMMIRAVPDGDEHDKDIANAIRYAVDNGARIISMSFGKDFSPQKQWVDDAFRYAEKKGVLLVHAAGNDAKNVDTADNFPNPVFIDGKGRATNVITVGASGDIKNGGLTAAFSNFGKKEVDVFAPGVNIYSSIPGDRDSAHRNTTDTTYGSASGTSMACPVVAGIAALVLEHYPTLTPQQLKYVIEKSAVAPADKVNIPGTQDKVSLSEISKTGGIVNAFGALKLAATIKTETQKEILPKSTIKKGKMG